MLWYVRLCWQIEIFKCKAKYFPAVCVCPGLSSGFGFLTAHLYIWWMKFQTVLSGRRLFKTVLHLHSNRTVVNFNKNKLFTEINYLSQACFKSLHDYFYTVLKRMETMAGLTCKGVLGKTKLWAPLDSLL